jgi:hypothetical protein
VAARWTGPEDALLADLYRTGTPLRAMSEQLGRSADAITNRRRVLGIADRRERWSEGHDRLIVAATRAGLPASVVARQLGVPGDRVRRRRAQLTGAASAPPRYTAAEDEAIRAAWAQGRPVAEVAAALGRPADGLRRRAQQLGVHRPPPRRRWTAVEDRVVRAGYASGATCVEIAHRLGGTRTPGAVSARAGKLGLGNYARRWLTGDDQALQALVARGLSVDQAAVELVRTPEAVRGRLRHLGLTVAEPIAYDREGRRWTEAEDRLMRRHVGSHPSALSWLLGRSDHAVRSRMRRLGLAGARLPTSHYPLPGGVLVTPGERAVIARELTEHSGPRLRAVALRLGRSPGEVRRLADDLRRESVA